MKIQFVLLVCFLVALVAGAPEKDCPETDKPTPIFIRDDEECGIFYECSAGKAYKFKCPQGTYWDVTGQICNIDVDCGSLKTTTVSTAAPTEETTAAPTEETTAAPTEETTAAPTEETTATPTDTINA